MFDADRSPTETAAPPPRPAAAPIPRELAARHLAVSPALLLRYEAHGLIHAVRAGDVEGYDPAELRRVWTVASLHRDAGVNLAGIAAILHLREQMDRIQAQLVRVARTLRDLAEPDDPAGNS